MARYQPAVVASAALHAGVVDLWADLRGSLAGQIAALRDDGTLPTWVEPEAMA